MHLLAGVDHLDFSHWKSLIPEIEPLYARIAQDGAKQAIRQLRTAAKAQRARKGQRSTLAKWTEDDLTSLANPTATAWAKRRSAELVGMKILPDGSIVPNPDPKWAITESTREQIREQVRHAIEDGDSNDTLADTIASSHLFSEDRAETIARTELKKADAHGALIGYQESGVEEKESLLSFDHEEGACEICEENAAEGPIPITDSFPSGDDEPDYHPNCNCSVAPVNPGGWNAIWDYVLNGPEQEED